MWNSLTVCSTPLQSAALSMLSVTHIMLVLVLNIPCMDTNMLFTINSFRQLFPDISLIFSKIPDISPTAVKFPDISRFSKQVVTLQTWLQTHATINSSSSAVAGVSWLEGCEWTLTTMLRPMTEFGPVSVILLSFTLMTASPFSSANTLPKSPTCLYKYPTTRTALGRVHVPPWLAVNKTC